MADSEEMFKYLHATEDAVTGIVLMREFGFDNDTQVRDALKDQIAAGAVEQSYDNRGRMTFRATGVEPVAAAAEQQEEPEETFAEVAEETVAIEETDNVAQEAELFESVPEVEVALEPEPEPEPVVVDFAAVVSNLGLTAKRRYDYIADFGGGLTIQDIYTLERIYAHNIGTETYPDYFLSSRSPYQGAVIAQNVDPDSPDTAQLFTYEQMQNGVAQTDAAKRAEFCKRVVSDYSASAHVDFYKQSTEGEKLTAVFEQYL